MPQNTLENVADFSDQPTKLDGFWVRDLSPTLQATKCYFEGRVFVTHIDTTAKTVVSHMAGIFSFDGKILREKMSCATTDWKQYVGIVVMNRVGFEGNDVYAQTNTRGDREV